MDEPTDHPFRDFLSTLRDEWERKTLLDFLRTEIDRQETESKRPGWTTWALFAAGAALISYLLSALEPAGANWHNIGVLFIFLSVAADCATFLANILRGKPEDQEQQRRFEFTSAYATDSRFFAIVMLLRMVFLYGVYRHLDFGLSPLFCLSLVTFLWLNILLAMAILVLSCLRLPLPKSSKTKRWWALAIALILWVGTGIAACLGIMDRLDTLSPSIQDWRVATALVGISLIVLFLSRLRQAPALLEDLRRVERRLALGQITLPEAQEKADRILHGLTLGDLMEPYVRAVLYSLDALESEHKEFIAEVAVLRNAIADSAGEHNQEQMTTINALLRGIEGKANDIVKMQQNADVNLIDLKKRVQMFKRMTPHLEEEIAALMSEVLSATLRAEKAFEQIRSAVKQLKAQMKTSLETANKAMDSDKE